MIATTEESHISAHCNFDARVLNALRLFIERSEVFDEFEVHAIFDLAEEALADMTEEPQVNPEIFAARILNSAAVMMSYGPGWRLSH